MKNSLKILLSAAAGVAMGMTVGILFAPDKGTATRRKITQKGEEYVEELESKFHEFVQGVNAKLEALKEEANRMVHKDDGKTSRGSEETAKKAV
jgi:gas vesicle protein